MTYRDRRYAKAERLREWADKREAKAEAAYGASAAIADQIPFGQPILVGHHSEKRARKDQDRIWNNMGRGVENERKAEEFRRRAANIEAAADHAIYSDDPDAIERLAEKIEKNEAKRAKVKEANAAFRKANKEELKGMTAWQRSEAAPYPAYVLTNLSGLINKDKKRLEHLKRKEVA